MFELIVRTLEKNLFRDHVACVAVPTSGGEVSLLPDHINYIAYLIDGSIQIWDGNHAKKDIPIERGYVRFSDNVCEIWMLN